MALFAFPLLGFLYLKIFNDLEYVWRCKKTSKIAFAIFILQLWWQYLRSQQAPQKNLFSVERFVCSYLLVRRDYRYAFCAETFCGRKRIDVMKKQSLRDGWVMGWDEIVSRQLPCSFCVLYGCHRAHRHFLKFYACLVLLIMQSLKGLRS